MPDEKCILDPQRDCIGKAEAAKLEGRIKALEDWRGDSKSFHNNFYDWQRTQIAREAREDERLSRIETSLNQLVSWKDAEVTKPGKLWDKVLTNCIVSAVSLGVGYIFAILTNTLG